MFRRLRALIGAGADVNAFDNHGRTALMRASGYGGDVERVRALIRAGADVNAANDYGWTALMEASGDGGDVERVRALIRAGADVNAVDDDGETALMEASRLGDVERVRALIRAGADVNAVDDDGGTALMEASRRGDVERVRALIGAGADVNAVDDDGETALMFASGDGGDVERVRALIEAGADVNATSKDGSTALSIAWYRGTTDVAGILMEHDIQQWMAAIHIEHRVDADMGASLASPDGSRVVAPDIDSPRHAPPQTGNHALRQDYVDISHITLGRELGRGSFATVYEATWQGVAIAIKQIRPPQNTTWSSADRALVRQVMEEQVQPEVRLMSAIRHPFVVGCYGCSLDPPSVLLELCPRGSLGQLLGACHKDAALRGLMSWRRRLCMLRQVATAMQFLHSKRVFHRDLRAMNVVVSRDMTAKVSDVGLGRFADEVSSRSAGTLGDGANPRWLAPELFTREQPFTQACDVYGFGTIVWEMMEWRLPWETVPSVQIIGTVLQGGTLEVAGPDRWASLPGPGPKHPGTMAGVSSLATKCLGVDPSARPCFADVVQTLLGLEEQEPPDQPASDEQAHSPQGQGGGGAGCSESGSPVLRVPGQRCQHHHKWLWSSVFVPRLFWHWADQLLPVVQGTRSASANLLCLDSSVVLPSV